MSRVKLFTHTDLDGVGCAILAYLAFGKENVDVEYCNYDDVDERVRYFYLHNDVPYDYIYITDIGINEENAQEIDSWVARDKVRLFDHHATALWLNQYDWCQVLVEEYGTKTSGTFLFFEHLRYDGYLNHTVLNGSINNITRFAEMVRDYDTWRWKELGEDGIVCKQMNDLFYIYGREEFINWAIRKIKNMSSLYFPRFDEQDIVLLEQKQKEIDIYIEQKNKQLTMMRDSFGYKCGVVFYERYASELGNRLCEMHPELDYVAMIDISKGVVSYRTVKDNIDLGCEIAHSFGGGGHKKAAGSTFDADRMRDAVVEKLFG